MKKRNLFLTILFFTISLSSFAQLVQKANKLHVGTTNGTIDTSAALEVTSTTKGLLPPRMTEAQRDAITSPATGLIVYNTTQACLQVNIGTATAINWLCISVGGASSSSVLAQIGNEGDAPDTVNSVVTVSQLRFVEPSITGLLPANEAAYQDYIDANPGSFSNPATQAEVQAMVNIVNGNCGAFVASGVFKKFMCHNLGADESLDPNVPVQSIHGNYYQWGRNTVVADASTPSGTISGWNTNNAASDAWQDATKTATDPCPDGYRVPTNADWTGVADATLNTQSTTGTFTNSATNFGAAKHFGPNASTKTLTLPAAGYRLYSNGALYSRGLNGYYWSSTESSSTNARALSINSSNAFTSSYGRANGFSVRCVSE